MSYRIVMCAQCAWCAVRNLYDARDDLARAWDVVCLLIFVQLVKDMAIFNHENTEVELLLFSQLKNKPNEPTDAVEIQAEVVTQYMHRAHHARITIHLHVTHKSY
jgi:hypothetical protein